MKYTGNVGEGTLTIHMNDPYEHTNDITERFRFLERVFMAAANCTDTDAIAGSDQNTQIEFYRTLEEFCGQSYAELSLCQEMVAEESNKRHRELTKLRGAR